MANKKMKELSRKMKKLDICLLTTQKGRGTLYSRPMSNNGDVEYDGNSYFFSFEDSSAVQQITKKPAVSLGFEGPKNLFITVSGTAKLIRTKSKMEDHWQKQLQRWFPEGLDTPGIVMIHVKAKQIKYWQNEDQGEISL